MNQVVVIVVAGYAVFLMVAAAWLGRGVQTPRKAPGAMGALVVLLVGGLGTSVSAFARCFEGGALTWPGSLAVMAAAWVLALPVAVWAVRRLARLASSLRRRGVEPRQ